MIITTQSEFAAVGAEPSRDNNDARVASRAKPARCRVGSPGGTISILKRALFGALAVATVGPFAKAG